LTLVRGLKNLNQLLDRVGWESAILEGHDVIENSSVHVRNFANIFAWAIGLDLERVNDENYRDVRFASLASGSELIEEELEKERSAA